MGMGMGMGVGLGMGMGTGMGMGMGMGHAAALRSHFSSPLQGPVQHIPGLALASFSGLIQTRLS